MVQAACTRIAAVGETCAVNATDGGVVCWNGLQATRPASVLQGKLVFTTVHKIKGAESPRTWVLDETFGFRGEVDPQGTARVKNGDTMTSNARQEEVNLWYVAVTRVKNQRGGAAGELYFVRNLEQLLGGGYVEEEEA